MRICFNLWELFVTFYVHCILYCFLLLCVRATFIALFSYALSKIRLEIFKIFQFSHRILIEDGQV